MKACAHELGLPLSSRVADIVDADVELGVVVAFGTLIGAAVLARVPMVNLHFSLLPRWRGAAPVERAILAGDEKTGVCLMALDEGLDTGPVYACVEVPILSGQTATELRAQLARLGTALLLERLADGVATLGTPVPQEGEAVYAAKIDPAELRLDWGRSAVELDRLVRIGRSWTTFRGRRLFIVRARIRDVSDRDAEAGAEPGELVRRAAGTLVGNEVICAEGALELLEVKAEGRSVQPFDAWRRGARPGPGELLGEQQP